MIYSRWRSKTLPKRLAGLLNFIQILFYNIEKTCHEQKRYKGEYKLNWFDFVMLICWWMFRWMINWSFFLYQTQKIKYIRVSKVSIHLVRFIKHMYVIRNHFFLLRCRLSLKPQLQRQIRSTYKREITGNTYKHITGELAIYL